MKISGFNNIIVSIVSFLFVLLFVYASVNKVLEFETFRVQLAQSPLLSAFAGWVSIFVPLTELMITGLLIFPKTRLLGLFSALALMTMFTVYIFIVLHFSSFVPCSCGGILEKMSWNVHLFFNLFFIILALTGVFLYNDRESNSNNYNFFFLKVKQVLLLIFISVGAVVILFLSSEEIIHRNNPFIRRYIRQTVKFVYKMDLKYNSYYFAGADANKVYLGNLTDPFGVLCIDTLQNQVENRINFVDTGEPFKMIYTKINPPYFYLMDGTVPSIYEGRINNWQINRKMKNLPRFTSAVSLDSVSIAFRNNTGFKSSHILGVYSEFSQPAFKYFPKLLRKQIDGIFDTDGILLYNNELKEILYVYYYRNEFIMFDKDGIFRKGNTIDTITKAKIQVTDLKNHTQRRLSAPPFFVNALATTKKNLLFIHSKVPGRFENRKNWKEANVIDVYNITNKTYLVSFPIYTFNGKKIKGILATNTHFYVLSGNEIYAYQLKGSLGKIMKE